MAQDPTVGRSPQRLRLLVLGGTRFVGRAFVGAALRRGHSITLFNRGTTNPGLFGSAVEHVRGDRSADLSALEGRSWDAVIDVAAYQLADVARSLAALSACAGRYLFVSTVSVYSDQSVPPVEGAAVEQLSGPDDSSPESYGARKAACEGLVREALGERATIVRPGLIVGPFDPTDRFSYWPRRVARGGTVLAPGGPADPLQFIDVRDLAAFMLLLVESGAPGTFNATGETISFGSFLGTCLQVTGSDAHFAWVPSDQLLQAGVKPWMGIPLWISVPGWEGANRVNISRALAAGLTFRALQQTVQAALDSPLPPVLSDFTAEREGELLASLPNGR